MIEFFSGIDFDWLRNRRRFFGISAILLIVGLTSVVGKGSLRYGVDFQGGRS